MYVNHSPKERLILDTGVTPILHPKFFVTVDPAAEALGNGTPHAASHELSVNARPSCSCSDLDGSATDNRYYG